MFMRFLAIGAFVLFKKYRKYRGTQESQQVGAILWALGITGIVENSRQYRLSLFRHLRFASLLGRFLCCPAF